MDDALPCENCRRLTKLLDEAQFEAQYWQMLYEDENPESLPFEQQLIKNEEFRKFALTFMEKHAI